MSEFSDEAMQRYPFANITPPLNWSFVALEDIAADVSPGFASGKHNSDGTGIPHLRPMNVDRDGQIDLNVVKSVAESNGIELQPGDVLFNNTNSAELVGKTAAVSARETGFAFSNHMTRIRPEFGVNPVFAARQLHFLWMTGYMKHRCTNHVNQASISSKTLAKTIPFLLPPAAEQTRIVAKLEELLSDLDAGVTELKAAQKKLAQYRQSLLKAAVEGALTAEWREAQRKRHSTPLSPRGRGVGGEGVQALNTSDETWFRDRARQLRQEQTPMEQRLWQQLRAKRFSGFKFRRQQKIGRYIVDFVCFAQKLIIELDGSQHADAQVEDAARDHWLRGEGFRVLRFWNNELLGQTDAVLEVIWQALQQDPPLPNPSPTRGEGLNTPLLLNGGGARGEGETGAQLLQRILTERRARWEAKQLAKFAEQGKTPPKDWQKKYPEPVQPEPLREVSIPESWCWTGLEQLSDGSRHGLKAGPFGSALKKEFYVASGYKIYGQEQVIRGDAYYGDYFIAEEKYQELIACAIKPRDLLISLVGTTGKILILPEDAKPGIINPRLLKVSLALDHIDPDYIKTVLESPYARHFYKLNAHGGTMDVLNLGILKELAIPLPPLLEQSEIVSQLSEQLALIADQEAAIAVSFKQSNAQRQNILRAAFSGQLVPQDPNDEPASVLLARIRAERAVQSIVKKPRGRKARESA